MIRLFPILMFSVLAAVLLFGLMRQDQPDRPVQGSSALLDQTLPVLSLVDEKSAPASFDPVEAYQVTVINFLASWCAPCAAEMGELVALKKAQPDVQFLGVVWNDSPARMAPWLKEHGNPFDLLRYDANGRAAINLGLRGIPETFIIDHHGVVRYQLRGILSEQARTQEVMPLLAKLQKEAADAR